MIKLGSHSAVYIAKLTNVKTLNMSFNVINNYGAIKLGNMR
jgi:hypothetical protein